MLSTLDDKTTPINIGVTMTDHAVLTIPLGLGPTGHPFAVNLIGRYLGDSQLIRIAATIEPSLTGDERLQRPRPNVSRFSDTE